MLTPIQALAAFNGKFGNVLPKGVTAYTYKKSGSEGIMVGTKDLVFVLQGNMLAHGEEYMLHLAKESLKSLKEALEVKPSGSHKLAK